MPLSRPLIAFASTWGTILSIFVGYAIYYTLTATEPDLKFGEFAPYVALAVFGGLGGFIASLAALLATAVFQWKVRRVPIGHILRASSFAAIPLAAGAWYAATHSPLSESGTIAAWFVASFLLFTALLHAIPPKREA